MFNLLALYCCSGQMHGMVITELDLKQYACESEELHKIFLRSFNNIIMTKFLYFYKKIEILSNISNNSTPSKYTDIQPWLQPLYFIPYFSSNQNLIRCQDAFLAGYQAQNCTQIFARLFSSPFWCSSMYVLHIWKCQCNSEKNQLIVIIKKDSKICSPLPLLNIHYVKISSCTRPSMPSKFYYYNTI